MQKISKNTIIFHKANQIPCNFKMMHRGGNYITSYYVFVLKHKFGVNFFLFFIFYFFKWIYRNFSNTGLGYLSMVIMLSNDIHFTFINQQFKNTIYHIIITIKSSIFLNIPYNKYIKLYLCFYYFYCFNINMRSKYIYIYNFMIIIILFSHLKFNANNS